MWQASEYQEAPARHQPLTAAMTGLPNSQIWRRQVALALNVDGAGYVGVLGQPVGPLELSPSADVVPGGKCPPGPGEHDGPNLGIVFGLREGAPQLGFHLSVDGVHHLGSVESDQHSLSLLLVQDRLVVWHCWTLLILDCGGRSGLSHVFGFPIWTALWHRGQPKRDGDIVCRLFDLGQSQTSPTPDDFMRGLRMLFRSWSSSGQPKIC